MQYCSLLWDTFSSQLFFLMNVVPTASKHVLTLTQHSGPVAVGSDPYLGRCSAHALCVVCVFTVLVLLFTHTGRSLERVDHGVDLSMTV